jgi:hypothetical protein
MLDCAISCGTVKDYALLSPTPEKPDMVSCYCVSAHDPAWVNNMLNVRGLPDAYCEDLRCRDGSRCGGLDESGGGGGGVGVQFAAFLIDNPDPENPTPQLTHAAKMALNVSCFFYFILFYFYFFLF